MKIPKQNGLLKNARLLRKNMTPQERKLWYLFLRHYPIKFYKQRIIETYIADFYCSKAKLVLEIDGSQHYSAENRPKDQLRSAIFEKYGILVVRFSNKEINDNFPAVCDYIHQLTQQRIKS